MNTPDTHALQMLLEREEAQRDAAALAVRQSQEHVQRLQSQTQQFMQHRADYITRWQQQFHQAGGIEIVHCYNSFMHRLDQAMTQLGLQQRQAEINLQRQRHRLVETETRVAAIRKLIDRRLETHDRTQQRREQKQADESAQRAAWLSRQSQIVPVLG
jgi:flagellar FliJ protein